MIDSKIVISRNITWTLNKTYPICIDTDIYFLNNLIVTIYSAIKSSKNRLRNDLIGKYND